MNDPRTYAGAMSDDDYRPMMSKERAKRLRKWHDDAYEGSGRVYLSPCLSWDWICMSSRTSSRHQNQRREILFIVLYWPRSSHQIGYLTWGPEAVSARYLLQKYRQMSWPSTSTRGPLNARLRTPSATGCVSASRSSRAM